MVGALVRWSLVIDFQGLGPSYPVLVPCEHPAPPIQAPEPASKTWLLVLTSPETWGRSRPLTRPHSGQATSKTPSFSDSWAPATDIPIQQVGNCTRQSAFWSFRSPHPQAHCHLALRTQTWGSDEPEFSSQLCYLFGQFVCSSSEPQFPRLCRGSHTALW